MHPNYFKHRLRKNCMKLKKCGKSCKLKNRQYNGQIEKGQIDDPPEKTIE